MIWGQVAAGPDTEPNEPRMGVFDQAARYAAQNAAAAVVERLLAGRGTSLQFRDWLDTRTIPLPGRPDRTADMVAALDDVTGTAPWLLVLEFQAQPDPDKLDVTLEEVALLRSRARHGDDRKAKYQVTAALIYLRGSSPEEILDMTLPDGSGTRHAPLVWNVAADGAAETGAAVADGRLSWGMLFWVPLMAGGGEEAVITRWKEVVPATGTDRRMRGNLAGIALMFAELAGTGLAWKQGLEDWEMTESQVVNGWIAKGREQAELKDARDFLIRLLRGRFGGAVPDDVLNTINMQPSPQMLKDWFDAAVTVSSMQEFIAVLRR